MISRFPKVSYGPKTDHVEALQRVSDKRAMSGRSFFTVHCAKHAVAAPGSIGVAVGAFNYVRRSGIVFG